ncbi:MAG: acyl carrier protein [Tatlockia sp.]|nr:acyl carrier protein [Tatlockia sp.]
MKHIEEPVRNFLCKHLNVEYLDAQSDIFQLGFVNSLFALQIVNFLEKQFSIRFENEDLKVSNFNTIHNICAFLAKKTEYTMAQSEECCR